MKMHLNLQLKIVRWSLAPLALWLCCGRVAAQTPVVDRNSIAGTTVLHTSHSISPRLRLEASYARLPLVLEPNQGQCDSRAKYLARGNGYTLFLTLRGAVLSLSKQSANNAGTHPHSKRGTEFQDNRRAAMLGMKIVGGNPNPHVVGSDTQLGTTNYFLGSAPRNWHVNVPQYGRVRYRGVYPGVDLVFHGEQQQLEFDFVVAPGAHPEFIRLGLTSTQRVTPDNSGNLVLSSPAGDLTLHKPFAYQEKNGIRFPVDSRFVVKGEGQVSFALGNYDHTQQLVIDPTLVYSTYLGGAGDDAGLGIAVDNSGNAYITGTTNSLTFPGTSGSPKGGYDAFVTKLNADGNAILYSTFLGGSSDDGGTAIAVDSSSNVYIAGKTSSADFPVTDSAAQTRFGGAQDGFVAKLNPTGSMLTYATFIGGSGNDSANSIAIDGSGNAYVSGGEQSTDFPTTPGSFQTTTSDGMDAFVTKLNPTGSAFVYSTYLGGSSYDTAHGIALIPGCASSCNTFVVGETTSRDFPVKDAFQSTLSALSSSSAEDAFVTQLNGAGSALVYSTFLGGGDIEQAFGIAVDSFGAAYVTGYTLSDDFPLAGAFQPELHGFADGFVTKLSPDGSKLTYSSYLGSGDEGGLSIAVDSHGNAYIIGTSRTNLFLLVDPIQSNLQGDSDAFVTMIDPTGASIVYFTYLGGDGDENYKQPTADLFGSIAVGASGAVYITGRTTSASQLPAASPLQGSFGGGSADAYVAKLSPVPSTPEPSIGVFPNAWSLSSGGTASPITVTVTPLYGFNGTVDLACSGLPAHAGCSFNPPSVTTSGTSVLTISTNEATAQLAPSLSHFKAPLYAVLLPTILFALLGTGFSETPARDRRLGLVLCLLFSFGLAFLAAACGSSNGTSADSGGNGGGGGGGTATTPQGTYSIMVNGTSGTGSHNAVFTLKVN